MFRHFPSYDDPLVDPRHPADELQWDALLGIPQIGCESIITASHSNEEMLTRTLISTPNNDLEDLAFFCPTDYGDITAGIHI